ncbi:MAG TPA: hypothetical protein VIB49_02850 [Thermoplasmata archaeon]|jgi:hypothetical protein
MRRSSIGFRGTVTGTVSSVPHRGLQKIKETGVVLVRINENLILAAISRNQAKPEEAALPVDMRQLELGQEDLAILTGAPGFQPIQSRLLFHCCREPKRGEKRLHFFPYVDTTEENQPVRCDMNGA